MGVSQNQGPYYRHQSSKDLITRAPKSRDPQFLETATRSLHAAALPMQRAVYSTGKLLAAERRGGAVHFGTLEGTLSEAPCCFIGALEGLPRYIGGT